MKKLFKTMTILGILLAGLGVVGFKFFVWGDYNYGSGVRVSQVFDGNISVVGDGSKINVERGSRVDAITIMGSRNVLTIEDGAMVGAIRGQGTDNRVEHPAHLDIDKSLLTGMSSRQEQTGGRPELDGL